MQDGCQHAREGIAGGERREEGSQSRIGRKLWTREIEPYFVERIKTSSPTSDLLPPQISPAPFALLSLLRDCHASWPRRCTTRSPPTSTASTSTRYLPPTLLL